MGSRAGDLMLTEGDGIKATITGVEQLGTESYLYCRTALDEAITMHQRGQTTAEKGTEVNLEIDAEAMHLFDLSTGRTCRA